MARPVKHSRYARYALYALLGLAALWFLRARGGPQAGAPAPAFDLPVVGAADSKPTRASLAAHQGKPLLIEVFASWCGTCRRSAPELKRAHAEYGDKLDFLGVSVDTAQEAAFLAKQQWGIPYAVAHDDTGAFARAYRIRVLPTFVLLDSQGRIAEVSAGMLSRGRLDEWAARVTH